MLFSSAIFLYLFLPLTFALYYLSPRPAKNYVLLFFSLIFFAWGGVSYSLIMILSVIMNYLFGLLIGKTMANKNKAKKFLTIGVALNLALLIVFKYADFVTDNLNSLLSVFNITLLKNPNIILPVGISFYTFHSLSYLVDIYRGVASTQKNFPKLALYISFFPQLIAGPIIRYHDVAWQLSSRVESKEKFTEGIQRFIIGLAKKVLIANTFGVVADNVFSTELTDLTAPSAWLGIISYTMQIYFDFSGYSDMAIGLGKMFGFEFLENFNFPYLAKSIKDFWRRWHISLSNWFRDYLYIPLGGNKKGENRTIINLLIVFFLTGLWHGASWSFVVWGLYQGFFLIIERLGFEKKVQKTPVLIQHIYVMFFAMIGWVFFRATNLEYAIGYIGSMFNFTHNANSTEIFLNYFTNEYIVTLCIALLGAFGFFPYLKTIIKKHLAKITPASQNRGLLIYDFTSSAFLIAVLLLCTVYLLANTYNPFIYYRF